MTRPFTRGGLRSPLLGDLKRPFLWGKAKRAEIGYNRRGDPDRARKDRSFWGI